MQSIRIDKKTQQKLKLLKGHNTYDSCINNLIEAALLKNEPMQL